MIKLKKIPKNGNLTTETVIAYDAKGKSKYGNLVNARGRVACTSSINMDPLWDVIHYIKLSDIDKEARRQIKEMKGGKV